MGAWAQNPWNSNASFGDNFVTLSNRLLQRCPAAGILLSQQFINDSWRELQARRLWSFRRRSGVIAPPALYNTGTIATQVTLGNPTLLVGTGTNWTPDMVGRQIRVGGLQYPFYTIIGWNGTNQLFIDSPWAGPDVAGATYSMLQCYYPVPADFGSWEFMVSIKDGYRLWTNMTQSDLALMDPQRNNFGQTYALAFRDIMPAYGGMIGPAVPVTSPTDPSPVSTTSNGYTYPVDATYIVQVLAGGASGAATYKWMRSGQSTFQGPFVSSTNAQDLSDGVQIYWPAGVVYVLGDIFVINCKAIVSSGVPRYELWPAPTYSGYLYPYQYITKEMDLTVTNPTLPPLVASRGEVLLEMGLEKCATYPGPDPDRLNPYYSLKQAAYHQARVADMLIDMERNDEEVAVSNIDYQMFPLYPAPWYTGQWQQTHAPFLNG